jgi:hypothetical protein
MTMGMGGKRERSIEIAGAQRGAKEVSEGEVSEGVVAAAQERRQQQRRRQFGEITAVARGYGVVVVVVVVAAVAREAMGMGVLTVAHT